MKNGNISGNYIKAKMNDKYRFFKWDLEPAIDWAINNISPLEFLFYVLFIPPLFFFAIYLILDIITRFLTVCIDFIEREERKEK